MLLNVRDLTKLMPVTIHTEIRFGWQLLTKINLNNETISFPFFFLQKLLIFKFASNTVRINFTSNQSIKFIEIQKFCKLF